MMEKWDNISNYEIENIKMWICNLCTYNNNKENEYCSMCNGVETNENETRLFVTLNHQNPIISE